MGTGIVGAGGKCVGMYNSVAMAHADNKSVGTTTLNPTFASKERSIAVNRFLKLQSNIRSAAALSPCISFTDTQFIHDTTKIHELGLHLEPSNRTAC